MRFLEPPQAVIFDIDGLLIDTVPLYIAAMIHASDAIGHPISETYVKSLIGLLGIELRNRLVDDLGPMFPFGDFLRISEARLASLFQDGVALKPCAVELLTALAARGVALAVATSLRTLDAEHHLNQTHIRSFFKVVVGRDDVSQSKPAPDVYLRAAAQLQLSPANCIALEDSFNGIRSAHAAGCTVIMVPDVLLPDANIRALCHAVASDLCHVRQILLAE